MNKKQWLILLFIILSVVFVAPIIIFIYHFFVWPPTFSNDLSDWSSVGGYFGGILGPISGIANIVVLWYITILVEKANTQRAFKDEMFAVRQFNIKLMQSSFVDIEKKFKEVDAAQIFELINTIEDRDITEEVFLKEKRVIKRSFLNLFNEVDFFKNNQSLVFDYLNTNNDNYPKQILEDIDNSIKLVIQELSGDLILNKGAIKKVIFDYFDARDRFFQSLLKEIKQSIKY
ncbi:hypothetical protein [uncultured Dokdonia sp.]|uniref:hypothetical protein n=1 Tax=uncultured Dokdonia sp. TaxID=575653 RepID=UPI002623D9D2|nr:hypothetical protein [uncultured Dokdonia sp.]